jgi:hypothetical protein
MRIHCRLLLGMFGLAIAAPSLAVAAQFGDDAGASAVVAGQPGPQSQPAPHHHHGLFGRRHCVECQRAYVKAHDGVDVPVPPPIETGAMMHSHAMVQQGGPCSVCQGNVVVTGPVLTADAHAPGYAVVGGGDAMASVGAPGYAVVNDTLVGQDPAPIGISRSAMAAQRDPRMAAMGPRPGAGGSYDPAVTPTSIPAAPTPMQDSEHKKRYQIVAHALGVPHFGARRRADEERERQKHAAISYDDPSSKVTELPASMVYDKGGH